jgi:uncharacterized protein YpmB
MEYVIVLLIVVAAMLMSLWYFRPAKNYHQSTNKEKDVITPIEQEKPIEPVFYGNGVYYFNVVEEEFGKELSEFIEKNPGLELVAIAPNDAYSFNRWVKGYFVVFRPKA